MKKLLLLCILFNYLEFNAQNLNVAGHHGIDKVGNIVGINSKCYYFETDQTDCCSRNIVLTGISSQGQGLFSSILGIYNPSWNWVKKMFKTNDNCLFLFGYGYSGCDTGGELDFFVKVDTLGHIMFQGRIQSAFNYRFPYGEIIDVAQYADSSYYMVSDSLLYHYSDSGQFISKINTGIKGINSITALTNGNFLLNGKLSTAIANIELTTSGTIISQQSSANAITKFIQNTNGDFYGRTSTGFINHYNASFALLNSSLSNSNLNITDFLLRHDSVFITGVASPPGNPLYGILNHTLGINYLYVSAYKNITPKGIALKDGQVTIITEGTSAAGTFGSFKGLYHFPLYGMFHSDSDIGVKKVSVTSYTGQAVLAGSYGLVSSPVYNLNVLIKNYGADTIHNFYLNHLFNFHDFRCNYLFHKLYTTTILPYDSVIVATGLISGESFTVPATTQPGDVVYPKLCFHTTVPNASNDKDVSNDQLCDSVAISGLVVTGIQQNSLNTIKINIFPNPFKTTLTIQADVDITQVEVYNALGVTQQKLLIGKHEFTLDNSALPAGIYFIKLETEKGQLIKKIIKE